MELQKDNDNEVSHFRTTKEVPCPVSDCNEAEEVISRHIPDNPYTYSIIQMAERKRALRDLVTDYPTLPYGWLEMAYDFEKNTDPEEIKKIINDGLWEGKGMFTEDLNGNCNSEM